MAAEHRQQVHSSAEAELYAINTGATEALHLRNLLMELLNVQKVNIKIQDPHRFVKWQEHGNQNRIVKESKTT